MCQPNMSYTYSLDYMYPIKELDNPYIEARKDELYSILVVRWTICAN
jgi:hypothetical protein